MPARDAADADADAATAADAAAAAAAASALATAAAAAMDATDEDDDDDQARTQRAQSWSPRAAAWARLKRAAKAEAETRTSLESTETDSGSTPTGTGTGTGTGSRRAAARRAFADMARKGRSKLWDVGAGARGSFSATPRRGADSPDGDGNLIGTTASASPPRSERGEELARTLARRVQVLLVLVSLLVVQLLASAWMARPITVTFLIAYTALLTAYGAEARFPTLHTSQRAENKFWMFTTCMLAMTLIFAPDSPLAFPTDASFAIHVAGLLVVALATYGAHLVHKLSHWRSLERKAVIPRNKSYRDAMRLAAQTDSLDDVLRKVTSSVSKLESALIPGGVRRFLERDALLDLERSVVGVFADANRVELNYLVLHVNLNVVLYRLKNHSSSSSAGGRSSSSALATTTAGTPTPPDTATSLSSSPSPSPTNTSTANNPAAFFGHRLFPKTSSGETPTTTTVERTSRAMLERRDHRNALLCLLCFERVGDLTTPARVSLLDSIQVVNMMRNPQTAALAAAAVANVMQSTTGKQLSSLKTMMDSKGTFHSMHKLLYHDVQDLAVRAALVSHFQLEADKVLASLSASASATKRRKQRDRKIISDVDDTLLSSGGRYPAGIDATYPRHTVYPGAFAFYEALDVGYTRRKERSNERGKRVVVVSSVAVAGGASAAPVVAATNAMPTGASSDERALQGVALTGAAPTPGDVDPVQEAMDTLVVGGGMADDGDGDEDFDSQRAVWEARSEQEDEWWRQQLLRRSPLRASSSRQRLPSLADDDDNDDVAATTDETPVHGRRRHLPSALRSSSSSLRALWGDDDLVGADNAADGDEDDAHASDDPSDSSEDDAASGRRSKPRSLSGAIASQSEDSSATEDEDDAGGTSPGGGSNASANGNNKRGSGGPRRRQVGNLVFLSARPHVYKDVAEKRVYAKFERMLQGQNLHSMPTLLPGDLESGQAYMLRGDFEPMAQKKFKNMVEYRSIYPEFSHVLVCDNGQADVRAGELMMERFGSDLEAVFVHLVQPFERTFGFNPTSSREKWSKMVFYKTFAGAATQACARGLFPPTSLARVLRACVDDFAAIPPASFPGGVLGREERRVELASDVERGNELLVKAELAWEQVDPPPALCHFPVGSTVFVRGWGEGWVRSFRPRDGVFEVVVLGGKATSYCVAADVRDSPFLDPGVYPGVVEGDDTDVRVGVRVTTPYGEGVVLRVRAEDGMVEVRMAAWNAMAYLRRSDVVRVVGGGSGSTRAGLWRLLRKTFSTRGVVAPAAASVATPADGGVSTATTPRTRSPSPTSFGEMMGMGGRSSKPASPALGPESDGGGVAAAAVSALEPGTAVVTPFGHGVVIAGPTSELGEGIVPVRFDGGWGVGYLNKSSVVAARRRGGAAGSPSLLAEAKERLSPLVKPLFNTLRSLAPFPALSLAVGVHSSAPATTAVGGSWTPGVHVQTPWGRGVVRAPFVADEDDLVVVALEWGGTLFSRNAEERASTWSVVRSSLGAPLGATPTATATATVTATPATSRILSMLTSSSPSSSSSLRRTAKRVEEERDEDEAEEEAQSPMVHV